MFLGSDSITVNLIDLLLKNMTLSEQFIYQLPVRLMDCFQDFYQQLIKSNFLDIHIYHYKWPCLDLNCIASFPF